MPRPLLQPTRAAAPALRRNVLATRMRSAYMQTGANLFNHTHHHVIALRGAFSRVRVSLHNLEAGTVNMAKAAVAVLPSTAANATAWAAATWLPLTFAGSASVTLPARVGAQSPSVTWSDWIDVASIPRNDGGVLPVLAVRVMDGGAAYSYFLHEQLPASESGATAVNETVWRTYRQAVDGIATPSAFTVTADTNSGLVGAVQTLSDSGVVQVAAFGDSIMQGARTSGGPGVSRGYAQRAAANLAADTGLPVEVLNAGFFGAQRDAILHHASQYLQAVRPHVALFPAETPNTWLSSGNTYSQAQADAAYSYVLRLADLANQAGAVPIVATVSPCDALSAADNARRMALNDRVRAAAGARTFVLADMDLALSQNNLNGTSQYLAGLNADTGPQIHPSDAGYAAMVPVAQAAMRQALGL